MKVEVNVNKRYFFGILAGILVIAGLFGVYANHVAGTPNPGHDINQVGGIPVCPSGQFLTHLATGGVTCATPTTAGGGGTCRLFDQSSDAGRDTNYREIDTPSECITDGATNADGCIIKAELWASNILRKIEAGRVVQDSNSGRWVGYGQTVFGDGYDADGNGVSEQILGLGPFEGGGDSLSLYDEKLSVGSAKGKWAVQDNAGDSGYKLYVCT